VCACWIASATSAAIWASRAGFHTRLAKQFLQVRSRNVLEHDEAVSTALLLKTCVALRSDELMDLHDARVVERGQSLRFLGQRHQAPPAEGVAGPGDLDGDFGFVLIVVRQENQEISSTQQPDHAEPADPIGHDVLSAAAGFGKIPGDALGGRRARLGQRPAAGRLRIRPILG
jgi:hypothetical protein